MTPWLTLVIPTMGRPELKRTLSSIDHQTHADGVEVLVVADTFEGAGSQALATARTTTAEHGSHFRWLEYDGGQHCVGQPQRQFGMEQAAAPWIAFGADDNILTNGALAAIWLAITELPEQQPLLFKVRTWQAGIVWRTPGVVAHTNVDADCIVVPNVPERLGRWGMRYEADFDFALETTRKWGKATFAEDLISLARPTEKECWWQ